MSLTDYLKNLLTGLIDSYKKLLLRTSVMTIMYTIFCFVVVALLLRFSDFDPSSHKKQTSLLSYFITNFSTGDTYSIVDLAYIVFLFFVSLFSISLIRSNIDEGSGEELKFGKSIKNILAYDIIALIIVLAISSLIDFLLFKSDRFLSTNLDNKDITWWGHNLLMYPLRGFIPWLLFSLTIYKVTTGKKLLVTFKKICFLFVSFWIINAFSYELSVYVRVYVIDFILIPLNAERKFFFESILGIGLIAFNFVGYYAVMTSSVKLVEEGVAERKD